ncbi:RcnB family protein [Sphingomonas arantia]|uniref:RcnB family protein n=1 Tax=Sphingomonas arantia TaxID=1460676 RepID=A0ABW4TVR7_9SPHN
MADIVRSDRVRRGAACAVVLAAALGLSGPSLAQTPTGGGWNGEGWSSSPWKGPAGGDTGVPQAAQVGNPAAAAFTGSYVRLERGGTMPARFAAPVFRVRDGERWGLSAPGTGQNWVRYYSDAVLVGADGRIADVRYGVDWNRPGVVSGATAAVPTRPRGTVLERAYDDGYRKGFAEGRGVSGDGVTVQANRSGYAPGTVVTTTAPGVRTTVTTVTEEIVPARRVSGTRRRR